MTGVERSNRTAIVIADALALLVFLIAGIRSHRGSVQVVVFLESAIPVGLAWAGASAIFGNYRRPGWKSLALTWAVAVPIGLLARTWLVGSPVGSRVFVFLGVGLAFTALFLSVGRFLAWVPARVSRRAPDVVR